VHASSLEPGPDHNFAASFQDSGGRTETLNVILRVAHASAIAEDVERAFGRLGRGSGVGAKRVDNGAQSASIQFRAALRCPGLAWAGCAENGSTGSVQSFLGVEPIENLSGLGKQFPGGVPDPGRAITQHHATGSLGEASPRCFPQYALGEVGAVGAGIGSSGALDRGRIRRSIRDPARACFPHLAIRRSTE